MDFVRTKDNVTQNAVTFEKYMRSDDPAEKEFAEKLLRNSKYFLVYKVEGENRFAPNSFVAYRDNSKEDHLSYEGKEKYEANPELDKILKVSAFSNPKTEEKFLTYMEEQGLKPGEDARKYWRLKDSRGKNVDFKEEDLS